jgi:uncharacterized protein YbgA (DUF1722 family)
VRIWDISPGYLNRQSLLGEHRELHGIHVILTEGKNGYARHPETMRWRRCLTGLAFRHRQLAAEMALRGYVDRSPLGRGPTRARWPAVFVTEPAAQIELLAHKYAVREPGRVPLPANAQAVWAHHKYSVMARSPEAYREIGRAVARMRRGSPVADLARELVEWLRVVPASGTLGNAIEHMWGHVRGTATSDDRGRASAGAAAMLEVTQSLAMRTGEPFLVASTALGELAIFARGQVRPAASEGPLSRGRALV